MTAYIPVILFAVLIGAVIGFYLSGGGDSYDDPVGTIVISMSSQEDDFLSLEIPKDTNIADWVEEETVAFNIKVV